MKSILRHIPGRSTNLLLIGSQKNSLEKAVLFYIKLNMGHGFRTNGRKVGWKIDVQGREKAYAAMDWCKAPERIMEATERLRGVQIENRSAVDLIRRFNSKNVLIYCDPPYVLSVRHGEQYREEMTDNDHMELLEALRQHRRPAIISGYYSPMYDSILSDWYREEYENYTQSGSRRIEIIWSNRPPEGNQMRLNI